MIRAGINAGSLRRKSQPFVRRGLFIFVLSFLSQWSFLCAQDLGEATPTRFDFTPLVGYRGGMNFPIEPNLPGTNPRMALDGAFSYGFAFGLRIRDNDVVEFRWTRQDSHTKIQSPVFISPRARVTLDQFHCDFSREYVLERWVPWGRPFIIGSVGATNLSNGPAGGSARFSVGIGGGVKFFVSRHLGFRMQAQWLPIFLYPQGTATCSSGCVLPLGGTLASQGEVAVGPILRF
jgi:hypothetical protein